MCVTYTRILLSLFFKNLWLQKKKMKLTKELPKHTRNLKLLTNSVTKIVCSL